MPTSSPYIMFFFLLQSKTNHHRPFFSFSSLWPQKEQHPHAPHEPPPSRFLPLHGSTSPSPPPLLLTMAVVSSQEATTRRPAPQGTRTAPFIIWYCSSFIIHIMTRRHHHHATLLPHVGLSGMSYPPIRFALPAVAQLLLIGSLRRFSARVCLPQ
ncbi:uncharacterized protein LOC130734077 [Lotus japonicus]|uniref:uncharacterized protein LOC130734077 n=1 Tax=Lotus japonicus TaxID=34305 RepID=UPI0025889E8A|nr:uncharacterized protein LOC130734077 [Lotus japonicus]